MTQKNIDENLMEKNLLELYKECNKNRIDYNTRKWETIKFFESIFTALIAAYFYGITTLIRSDAKINLLMLIGLVALLFCACIALYYGKQNLKRESKNLFIEEATMFKILKLIQIPNEVPEEKRWIKKDEYLLPEKYKDCYYKVDIDKLKENPTFNNWLDLRLEKDEFLGIFNRLFKIEIGISILLIIFTLIYYIIKLMKYIFIL